ASAPLLAATARIPFRVCPAVSAVPPAAVLVNGPRLASWLVWVSVAPPAELPVNVAAVISPPAGSVIVPAELKVTVVPAVSPAPRSEEPRVGKDASSRWPASQQPGTARHCP